MKYRLTSAFVIAVSELAKRSDRVGALLASLPMITLLVLIWLHVAQQSEEKIANHARYTFWFVLPTLPMFLIFPLLLPRWGFWPSLLACVRITFVIFALLGLLMRRFGITLW